MAGIYDKVVERLTVLGFGKLIADNEAAITYAIDRTAEIIKQNTNLSEVPKELLYTHVDMAAGTFLKDKKDMGLLGGIVDMSAPVKSISEGDVSVSFASAADGCTTPEARLDSLIKRLTNPDPSIFASVRRFKW